MKSKYRFEAIGTLWSIETSRPLSSLVKESIAEIIESFDLAYSRFRADSAVMLARDNAPGEFEFPPSVVDLYGIYQRLGKVTNGRVNPLVGVALENMGYDMNYSLRPNNKNIVPPPKFEKIVHLDGSRLSLKESFLIDFGAVGKGYLVDLLASVVAEYYDEYVIDASGDVLVNLGAKESIGLENPADENSVIGMVEISSGSICASAVNRRKWGDGLHHVIDASTARPYDGSIVATWAVADGTALADGLATGLFFANYESLIREFGDFFYVVMHNNGMVEHNINSIGEIY